MGDGVDGAVPGEVSALGRTLRARKGQVVLSRRQLRRDGRAVVLGHLLATRAGGLLLEDASWPGSFSVADGHLVRHRSGPQGEWARQHEDGRVDDVRRTAELAELALGRPLEPVLVLTGGPTAFAGAAQVRGVHVIALRHLDAWLDDLPLTTDQAGLSVLAGRMERTFPAAGTETRTPGWVGGTPAPPRSHRPAPSGARVPSGRSRAPRTGGRSRSGVLVTLAVVAASGLALTQLGLDRSVELVAEGWDRASSWVSPGGAGVPGPAPEVGDLAVGPPVEAAPALPPPVPAPVVLSSCHALTPEVVGGIVGHPVALLPGSTPSACHFGPFPDSPQAVWVSVATGAGSSELVLGGVNGWWTHSHGVGTVVPSAPGVVLGTEVAVAVDMGLYPDPAVSGAVAEQVVAALAGGS